MQAQPAFKEIWGFEPSDELRVFHSGRFKYSVTCRLGNYLHLKKLYSVNRMLAIYLCWGLYTLNRLTVGLMTKGYLELETKRE